MLLLLALSAVVSPAAADELRLDAKALFERSVTRDVRLAADGSAVELEEGELFEDDGPAAGYSFQPNEERLSDRVWIRKELVVPNPAARQATLLIGAGGDLKVAINGQPVELKKPAKAGNYWQAYGIPPEALKPGTNELVLHGSGTVWIARSEDFAAGSVERARHPGRSAKSTDGGTTWAADRLGQSGGLAGEYYVRLFLHHFRPAGSLTLPVMDAGNLEGRPVAPPLAKPIPVRVQVDSSAGRVRLRIRSGTTAAPDTRNWSDWQDLESGGELREPKGRFLQVALELSTADPLRSPQLKGLRIEVHPPRADDWSARLKVVESHNEKIVRSSIPFSYEPFNHPRLKELRSRHKLDEVVKGATTELELMERLAVWSAGCWERGHLKEAYPPWDALEILKPHADGTPLGGFCQQYNVVFLQACESFGIPGRAVSIGPGDHGGKVQGGGHEVVELWSNQFRKWIYVDGNMAWYAADAGSGEPLSLWELRYRQLRVLSGKTADPIRIVHLAKSGKRWKGLSGWPPFLELRLVPRSNFLEEKSPLPLHQGMRGWFWTGHYAWTDSDYPASLLYGNLVSDRRNWSWTLNQARYILEATAADGELRVHLDTETPGFDTFLADIDAAGAKPVMPGFVWKLRAGKNTLEVRPRNIAGRDGVVSRVVVDWP
ncbi:MAG: transglutaminase-like domain-containing protein [Pirellulaceae bacterium]